ncbi:MAG TPA: hypothetical protein VHM02_14255 [Thermoanaerobaculia bacterium]|nr:hypothetical protein [Thermoanaerobaculia bacterium]
MPATETLRWYYFIPRCGGEGQRWFVDYHASRCMQLTADLDRALVLLRTQRVNEGCVLLDRCEARLDAMRQALAPAVLKVAERWYFSTVAYYWYVVGDAPRALLFLRQAEEALVAAIDRAGFLVVLAGACCEFELHRARVARSVGDWPTMREHLEGGRAMVENRRPLCELDGGTAIHFRDYDGFFRTLRPRSEEERAAIAQLTDAGVRARGFELHARRVELLPNVVVPFQATEL